MSKKKVTTKKKENYWLNENKRMEDGNKGDPKAHLRGLHGLLGRWHLVAEIKKSRPVSGYYFENGDF